MLGCIQPMSSPMMNRMLGFCCAATWVIGSSTTAVSTAIAISIIRRPGFMMLAPPCRASAEPTKAYEPVAWVGVRPARGPTAARSVTRRQRLGQTPSCADQAGFAVPLVHADRRSTASLAQSFITFSASPHSHCAAVEMLPPPIRRSTRSEEHTSELQSRGHLVCRLLLEKKKKKSQLQCAIYA